MNGREMQRDTCRHERCYDWSVRGFHRRLLSAQVGPSFSVWNRRSAAERPEEPSRSPHPKRSPPALRTVSRARRRASRSTFQACRAMMSTSCVRAHVGPSYRGGATVSPYTSERSVEQVVAARISPVLPGRCCRRHELCPICPQCRSALGLLVAFSAGRRSHGRASRTGLGVGRGRACPWCSLVP